MDVTLELTHERVDDVDQPAAVRRASVRSIYALGAPNRHSDAHYAKTEHPVMRSIELGEAWRWCFVDGELG